MTNSPTPVKNGFFRRFFRNIPAVAGLGFILVSVVIALLGYAIVPDATPNADNQIPAIALQKPVFRVYVLPVATANAPAPLSWWQHWLAGTPAAFRYIPLATNDLRTSGDSLFFQPFESPGHWQYLPPETLMAGEKDLRNRIERRVFWLGTDKFGRDLASRLLLGFRVSLLIGLVAVVISVVLGTVAGAAGGYFGGRTDDLVVLLINTAWSIPTLLLVFAIVLALGRGIGVIFMAVGLTMWVDVARVVRGQVISLRQQPFITAAISVGAGTPRILFRHILPNLAGPLLVVAAGNFATAILIESGLSYLGLGVSPPTPSWGAMLYENYGYALAGRPFAALIPAFAIALSVLAFNLVGNGLRDAADVRSR